MPISITTPRGLQRLGPVLRTLVTQVLRGEGRRVGEIAVVLDDDDLLRQINCDWRGIDRATDVISFAYDEREPDATKLAVRGDVLVSMDRVAAQARRFRVTPGTELARLVVHGALHLCGHDHLKPGERKLMRAREASELRTTKPAARALDAVLARQVPANPAAPARSAKPKSARATAPKPARKPVASRAAKPAAKPTAKRRKRA